MSLFKVEAIVRTDRLDDVQNALDRIGVIGITVTQVLGHGKQRGFTRHYRGGEYAVKLLPKVKVESVVDENRVDEVVDAIIDAAHTGEVGDGKIFVLPVTDAIRVRTKESGTQAVA